MEQQMVKVSVEVRSGAARIQVGVHVQSIRKALSMVGGRYHRGAVKVMFPIEPEGFFSGKPSALARIAVSEQIHTEAA